MMLRRHLPRRRFHRIQPVTSKTDVPTLYNAVLNRDFIGANTILEFSRESDESEMDKLLWLGYCNFHSGNYEKAQSIYIDMLTQHHDINTQQVSLCLTCVYYYLQMYKEARETVSTISDCSLKNRLMLHLAIKNPHEKIHFLPLQEKLGVKVEDLISLAASYFKQTNYQSAIDVCKKILKEKRENLAFNVYLAMCYFKLDYYDVSLEILSVYLQTYPDSPIAVNLKACNHFRLYDGKAAVEELHVLGSLKEALRENHLIRHNMVVFKNGNKALQVFSSLIDIIPEARSNLAIYYLKKDNISEAITLLKDMKPTTAQEYILHAIVQACKGQNESNNEKALSLAQDFYQKIGTSPSECDTIPGRQCMASFFFLKKQFEDVNVYLHSVKSYMSNDDDFNWNYAISLASSGDYQTAEERFILIENEGYQKDIIYLSWLCRCYIINGNPSKAWDLYSSDAGTDDSFILLQLIANECYRMGHFIFAAKAFNVLERADPDPEFWEGKRGACVGVLQGIIAEKEKEKGSPQEHKQALNEIIAMLTTTNNPQSQFICEVIKDWGRQNEIKLNYP